MKNALLVRGTLAALCLAFTVVVVPNVAHATPDCPTSHASRASSLYFHEAMLLRLTNDALRLFVDNANACVDPMMVPHLSLNMDMANNVTMYDAALYMAQTGRLHPVRMGSHDAVWFVPNSSVASDD